MKIPIIACPNLHMLRSITAGKLSFNESRLRLRKNFSRRLSVLHRLSYRKDDIYPRRCMVRWSSDWLANRLAVFRADTGADPRAHCAALASAIVGAVPSAHA